jgi:hypothetical protein
VTDWNGVPIVVLVAKKRDLELLPCYRNHARLLHPKARRDGADGVRRARVDAGGEAQGDHFPLPSSSGMKMETGTP